MTTRSGGTPHGCRSAPPATLSTAEDALLLDLAVKIEGRGLAAPALLWLESLRPVSFLGSQLMHFLNPFVRMIYDSETFEHLARILEDREHLERLLRHIECVVAERQSSRQEGGS